MFVVAAPMSGMTDWIWRDRVVSGTFLVSALKVPAPGQATMVVTLPMRSILPLRVKHSAHKAL